ncbi:MAG: hypothetical protein VX127_11365 [Myxococcota bacterium]|nr:hypothetical protein [Myxococcota bacterium]
MAYLMLVVGVVYSVTWGMGLMFASKSDGPRNTVVPALGLIAFLGLSGMSAMAAKDAMDNPQRLTPEGFLGIAYNQTVEDVEALLGSAEVEPDRSTYNLTGRGLVIPSEISARLPAGENSADAIPAKLVLTVVGEAGRRNQRNTLGARAANEGNGLSGLQIVLRENGNEVTFTEGEDWTYENNDTAETVAKKIGEAIDAHESWTAEGSTELAPTKVIIESALETNIGTLGNDMEGWVATGANTALKVGIVDNGSTQNFRGGMDSVDLKFWVETEAVLDGNFSMTDRLVLAGFIDGKLKAVRQAGIDLTTEQINGMTEAITEARIAEEEALAAAKEDKELKMKEADAAE